MESRVCADGHVGSAEVIINGTNHANDIQVLELLHFIWLQLPILDEFLQKTLPFLSEEIGTSQATVAADDNEVADAVAYQIVHRLQPPFTSPEFLAPRTSDDGSTLRVSS